MQSSFLFGIVATCIFALTSARNHRSLKKFLDEDPESLVNVKATELRESHEDYYLNSLSPPVVDVIEEVDHEIPSTSKPSRRQNNRNSKRRNRKNRKHLKHLQQKRNKNTTYIGEGTRRPKKESDRALQKELDSFGPTKNDLLVMAQQHAMKVIVEKMIIAFGPDFIEEKHKAPKNIDYLGIPTVASPLNITTEPCPSIYAKCSSEIFYAACYPPPGSNRNLWKQRFNFYFDLPEDLLANTDELLNGTVRIYKSSKLPLTTPVEITVHIHSYTASFTIKKDWNILINSIQLASDYIGWVTLDVSDWARQKHRPDKNFGFFIKISDDQGILWNDPEDFFEQRNCSEASQDAQFVPVPFGVETNEPKEKFPSLTIHTGMWDHYYTDRTEEDDEYPYYEEHLHDYEENIYEIHEDEDLVNEGKDLVNEGIDLVNEGKELVNKGEELVNKGEELVNKGEELANEDEDKMRVTSSSPSLLSSPHSLSVTNDYVDNVMPRADPQVLKQVDDSVDLSQENENDTNESELEKRAIDVHQTRVRQIYFLPRKVLTQKPQSRYPQYSDHQKEKSNVDHQNPSSLEESDRSLLSNRRHHNDNYQSRIVTHNKTTLLSLPPPPPVQKLEFPSEDIVKPLPPLQKKQSVKKSHDGQKRRARMQKKKRNIKHRHNHHGKESRRRRNQRQ